MRIICFVFLCCFALHAEVYYAKLEPIHTYTIKATYGAEVLESHKNFEATRSLGQRILWLDDSLDKKELASTQEKIKSLRKNITLLNQSSTNAKESAGLKEENYERMRELKTKSKVEKENERIALLNAQNSYLTQEQSIQNQHIQLSELEYYSAVLKDKIAKKNIEVDKGFLIYKIYPSKGDFVSSGASLAEVYDVRQGKLSIFLSYEDAQKAANAIIYIDGEKTNTKIDKIWEVADTQNISAYRAEIIVPNPSAFSVLKKIEFKDK